MNHATLKKWLSFVLCIALIAAIALTAMGCDQAETPAVPSATNADTAATGDTEVPDTSPLTVKGEGFLQREEFELPLKKEQFKRLAAKSEGRSIAKDRYCIPYGNYTIELDIFAPPFDPLILAEVEFPSVEEANAFTPPEWFGVEVTEENE